MENPKLLEYRPPEERDPDERKCFICGCCASRACLTHDHGACYWLAWDLCSACSIAFGLRSPFMRRLLGLEPQLRRAA